MKKNVLLLSDIHGNLPALEAVLEDVKHLEFEAILCNGDMIYGSKPNECLERLLDLDAIMIAGNIETSIIRLYAKLLPPEIYQCDQFAFTRHIAKILKKENLLALYKIPQKLVINDLLPGSILMVHGSPDDQYELIMPNKKKERFEEVMEALEEDFIIFGHTHQQWNKKHANKWAINSGSVGLPLNGIPKAQYTIITYEENRLDSIQINQKLVAYDNHQAYADFEEAGFNILDPTIKIIKERLLTGIKNDNSFLGFYYDFVTKETGKHFDEVSCDDKNKYWHLADQEYDWENNQTS